MTSDEISRTAADTWRIPPAHDPVTKESLARWEVLRKAGRFEWDDTRGTSWQKTPSLPRYMPLRDDLVAAGLDPDTSFSVDHDEALTLLRRSAETWSAEDAAAAFLAGLWSAPAAWRSALPSLLIARAMPEHPFTPWSDASTDLCQVCGYRTRPVQSLEQWAFRLTSGTPLDGDPVGYGQTMGWFGDDRPQPTEYDRWALGAILAVLRGLPAGTRYSAATKAITSAKILRGSATVTSVLEDLALIGVLAPSERPGMYERYTTYRERDDRPDHRIEVQTPLAWWDTGVGDSGVRTDVFDAVFGSSDIPAVSLDAPRPKPTPAAKDTIDGGLSARVRALTPREPKATGSVGDGPVAAGDVWAIRLEPGRWVTAYVHEIRERGRPYAHTEFLAGVFSDAPVADDVRSHVQPRKSGRAPTWVHSLDKTPWMRRIAQQQHAPVGDTPRPEDGSWVNAKDLRHLSDWHFG